MSRNDRGFGVVEALWALAAVFVIAAATLYMVSHLRESSTQFPTPYQAILLANGSVYFGHLQGYGGHQPILTDVFYIVTQTDPNTKQTKNVLVKRGKELHEPDRMYLNPGQIVFVETVGTDSKVAHLIAEASN